MKNADMKEKLLESFRELAKNAPIDKITVRQISEKCGVTTQTFYNHFPDKYELVHWAYQKRLDRLFKELESGEIDFKTFLRGYLSDYQTNSAFILNAVANTRGEDSYSTRGGRYFCESIEREMCRVLNVEELSLEYKLLIKAYVGGFTNLILYWLSKGDEISIDDMVTALADAVPQKLKDDYVKRNSKSAKIKDSKEFTKNHRIISTHT